MTPLDVLLALVDEAFDRTSWHGTTLRGSIRGLHEDVAAWRPAPHRHNIWEIVVHAAYWKYAVRRRLVGEKRNTFAHKGSNWFLRPGRVAQADTWDRDVALLTEQHRRLRQTVSELTARDLVRPIGSRDVAHLVRGIAAHDLYHAGQIQLIKRLHR